MTEDRHFSFESSIDEIVDVQLRLAARSPSFRTTRSRRIWLAGFCSAVVVLAIFFLEASSRSAEISAVNVGLLFGPPVLVGATYSYFFGRYYDWAVKRQVTHMLREQYGKASRISIEISLLPERVRVLQHGVEMTFPWTSATAVEDKADSIEIWFTPGLVVARNRIFPDPAARQAFLTRARALAGR